METLALPPRFWAKVDVQGPDDCWEWTAYRHPRPGGGYGLFNFEGKMQLAHRLTMGLRRGEPGCALHRCNNPPCVNPAHLYFGDQSDNMRDAIEAGTLTPPPTRHGEASNLSKLTAAAVVEIRDRYAAGGITMRRLSADFGVTAPTVCRIVNRELWAHI